MNQVGPVKRVTLWVRDIEASLALYRDLLGLDVVEDKQLEGPAVAALLGLEQGRLRIVHLSAAGHDHGWVGLYALTDAKPAPPSLPPPDPRRFSYGQAAVVMQTERLDALLGRLEAAGCRSMGPVIDYVKAEGSATSPAGRYREALFLDPDGIAVSLIQFDAR